MTRRPIALAVAVLVLVVQFPGPVPATANAQGAAPAPPAPPRTVQSVRNKISAADLASAESILEAHETTWGRDGLWLLSLAWVTRGALLLDAPGPARERAAQLRTACEERLAEGATLAGDDSLEYALGSCIEVEAQLLARSRGRDAAVSHVRGELSRLGGPASFRSRLNKRINLMTLSGAPAPELEAGEWIGGRVSPLAALRGRPVVLYLWDKGCGDCRAQAPVLARVATRHAGRGLAVVGLTRHYGEDHPAEIAPIDSAWTAGYPGLGAAPVLVSEASMVRYGGSSTPTFVFVDRRGVVRRYAPTRLTEAALEESVAEILR